MSREKRHITHTHTHIFIQILGFIPSFFLALKGQSETAIDRERKRERERQTEKEREAGRLSVIEAFR